MKKNHKMKEIVLKIADWLETIIAILLIITVIALGAKLIFEMAHTDFAGLGSDTMEQMLEYCFGLVIIIEFVRMLTKHSVGSIIEIILFSIARGMIAEHQNGVETVLLIVALMIAVIIRKYLLLSGDMEESKGKDHENS